MGFREAAFQVCPLTVDRAGSRVMIPAWAYSNRAASRAHPAWRTTSI